MISFFDLVLPVPLPVLVPLPPVLPPVPVSVPVPAAASSARFIFSTARYRFARLTPLSPLNRLLRGRPRTWVTVFFVFTTWWTRHRRARDSWEADLDIVAKRGLVVAWAVGCASGAQVGAKEDATWGRTVVHDGVSGLMRRSVDHATGGNPSRCPHPDVCWTRTRARWKALEHADSIGASSEIRDSQKVSCRCAQFHQALYFVFTRFVFTMTV